MARLSESKLRRLIQGGETTTVELKVAAPRPVELAERLCGMVNAQGGRVIIGVEDSEQHIVGVPLKLGSAAREANKKAKGDTIVLHPVRTRACADAHFVFVGSARPSQGTKP